MININDNFYRKYRPKNFSSVIGQQDIVLSLKKILINKNNIQSFIFSGCRGSGKTTLAKIYAKAVNCLHFIDKNDVCLECENCVEIQKENNIDVIELDAASNNGVSDIRNIIDNIDYQPQKVLKKVYIIDEAHMLSNAAWNALLKTIENPPSHVVFIFATTEYYKIPLTIISRCQRYDFSKLKNDDLKTLIELVIDKEKIKISSDAMQKLINLSDGAARDCLCLLEQLSIFTNKNIDLNSINKLFNLVDTEYLIDFLNILLSKDYAQFLNFLNKIENSIDISYFINELILVIIDFISYLKTNSIDFFKKIIKQDIQKVNNLDLEQLFLIIDILNQILKNNKNNLFFYFKMLFIVNYFNKDTNNNVNNIVNKNQQKQNIEINKEIISNNSIKNNNDTNQNLNNEYKNINFEKLFEIKQTKQQKDLNKQNVADLLNNTTNKTSEKKDICDKYYEIFLKIAFYNKKIEIQRINEELEKIKQQNFVLEPIKILVLANRFYVFSNDCYILVFNNSRDSKKFNNIFLDKANQQKILELLKLKNAFILAIDKDTIKDFLQKSKQENKKEITQITLKEIKQMLDIFDENEIKSKILDIID